MGPTNQILKKTIMSLEIEKIRKEDKGSYTFNWVESTKIPLGMM